MVQLQLAAPDVGELRQDLAHASVVETQLHDLSPSGDEDITISQDDLEIDVVVGLELRLVAQRERRPVHVAELALPKHPPVGYIIQGEPDACPRVPHQFQVTTTAYQAQ